MKSKRAAMTICVLLVCGVSWSQIEFSADSVKSACKRVARGRLKSTLWNGWQQGTYFEGIMALYYLTGEQQYLDSTIGWGEHNNWLSTYQEPYPTNFDNVCCYQAYLEAYMADPSPDEAWVEAPLGYVERYTYEMAPNNRDNPSWPIVDMYHMAAPLYPRAAQILDKPDILDSLYRFAVSNAKRHYNTKDSLFNSNCGDTNNVREAYWGRGCGWGVGAHCRILQWLPADHPSRSWYEGLLRACLTRLLRLQNQDDGMWRSDLINHPEWNKEASSTAFFSFGLFYGLRTGVLDSATFWEPALKAWKGLLDCIGVDPGRPDLIGWSQGVGGGPSNNFDEDNHDEYTEGAFLLAGYEFYQLLTAGVVGVKPAEQKTAASHIPRSGMRTVCLIGGKNIIRVPDNARGVELFTLLGQKIYETRDIKAGRNSIAVPSDKIGNSGMVIVRYNF